MSDAEVQPVGPTDSDVRDPAGMGPICCQSCPIAMKAGANYCPECGRGFARPDAEAQAIDKPETAKPSASAEPSEPEVAPAPKDKTQEPTPLPYAPTDQPANADRNASEGCRGAELPRDVEHCPSHGEPVKLLRQTHCFSYRSVATDLNVEMTDKELMIGKTAECELRIVNDDYVSRRHARLFLSDGKIHLEDLGSSNGTFLRVRKPIALEPGDEVLVGKGLLRLDEVRS